MRINADSVTDGKKYNSEHEVPAERHICVQTASQMERSTTANTRYPQRDIYVFNDAGRGYIQGFAYSDIYTSVVRQGHTHIYIKTDSKTYMCTD